MSFISFVLSDITVFLLLQLVFCDCLLSPPQWCHPSGCLSLSSIINTTPAGFLQILCQHNLKATLKEIKYCPATKVLFIKKSSNLSCNIYSFLCYLFSILTYVFLYYLPCSLVFIGIIHFTLSRVH